MFLHSDARFGLNPRLTKSRIGCDLNWTIRYYVEPDHYRMVSEPTSERGGGVNLSEDAEYLREGACRHLKQIPHRPCKGGELGI